MNKLILTLSVMLCAAWSTAQTEAYVKLRKAIAESHPEIVLDNKLIAFNIWSVSDPESREANKSFEKAYSVYEYAKLKGGPRGIVIATVNTDNLTGAAVITLNKDGVSKSISLKAEDLRELISSGNKNMVFDSNGNQVYTDLPVSTIFSSINQLITR